MEDDGDHGDYDICDDDDGEDPVQALGIDVRLLDGWLSERPSGAVATPSVTPHRGGYSLAPAVEDGGSAAAMGADARLGYPWCAEAVPSSPSYTTSHADRALALGPFGGSSVVGPEGSAPRGYPFQAAAAFGGTTGGGPGVSPADVHGFVAGCWAM
jgi:hypothetical protein